MRYRICAGNSKIKIYFGLPAQVTCNFGKYGLFFEAGMGSTLIFGSHLDTREGQSPTNEIYLSPIIDFRHESANWFGRIFTCPLFHITGNSLYDVVTFDFIKIGVGIGLVF